MSIRRLTVVSVPLLAAALLALWVNGPSYQGLRAQDARPAAGRPQAVEESMHEFMEYVFEPSYKRLKEQIAAEPSDKAGWKAVKADALLLAEATNLLWLRQPDENAAQWKQIAASVRESGARLYRSAGENNYSSARGNYETMMQQCNRCHQEFADGEYQLEP